MASTPMLSILLILTSIIISSFSCPVHQKQALLHFKSTLTAIYNSKYYVKFVELDSWNSTSDCCYWERVNCSRIGSVTELLLVMVAIPPPDFDPVPISFEILSPIFRIRSLELLDISMNLFEGEIPGDWFGNLSKLLHLDMRRNNFNGSIPSQLFQLTNLDYLDMSANLLEGKLGPELGSFPNLTTLALSDNRFLGGIPSSFANLTKLESLDLSENYLSGLIPKSISNLQKLQLLDLSRNRLSGDSLPFLGADYLDLSDNDFSGNIPTKFPKGTKMLYLGGNKFSGSLPFDLINLVNLRVLDLRNNIITGNLQDILPHFSTSLEILILRNTSLNGFIPNNISMCSSLRILDLSRNNLTGSIPRQIANLPIMNMSASSNPISRSYEDLNEDNYDHLSYDSMIFPRDPFHDPFRDSLQDLIVNWKKSSQRLRNLHLFVLLDLSGNNISGEIPASLGNLKALKQLNISHNKISGSIPLSLGNLVGIESLDVSHNELSGLIPQSLDQLGNLTVLDVSNNMLTGKIPRGRQMDTMDELSFQNNSGLCGMQINIECLEDIPSSEGRVEEEEDLSWIFWEGTWIGFPIGFFSTILIMSYLLNFIRLFKFW